MSLLIAERNALKLVQLEPERTPSIVVSHLKDFVDELSYDFAYDEGIIFWTDVSPYAVKRADLQNPDKHQETIMTHDMFPHTRLAVDWIARKLYISNKISGRIEVCDWDGNNRKALFTTLVEPLELVLDPRNGYMYWTSLGSHPKIEKASMDGNAKTRSVFTNKHSSTPRDLTIDYDESKLYWTDSGKILSCDLYRWNEETVTSLTKFNRFFTMTIYGDFLYWATVPGKSIYACNKRRCTQPRWVMTGKEWLFKIMAYMRNRQPTGESTCRYNNGGCSHLCLLSALKPYYTCACPTGILLSDNQTCAEGAVNKLVYSQGGYISQISLDTANYAPQELLLNNVMDAIALDFDPDSGFLFSTDDIKQCIERSMLNGTEQRVLLYVDTPKSIAVDWVAKNLYWTDTTTNCIEVSRLDGTSRKVVVAINLENPDDVCLDPAAGYMYWTDSSERRFLIEKAYLDGSHREVVVSDTAGWASGLALDLEERLIFWSSTETEIEVCRMDGSARRVLLSENLHVFGLTLLGDYIYWRDKQSKSIERINKHTGKDRTLIIDDVQDLMDIKAFGSNHNNGTNTCGENNGNCSHLCLFRPPPLSRVCACPLHYELKTDEVTCVLAGSFLVFAKDPGGYIRKAPLYKDNYHKPDIIILRRDGFGIVKAIDFDAKDDRIYWSENSNIYRAFLNGSDVQTIVHDEGGDILDIAVDWLARNIYWTSKDDLLKVARLDGSSRVAFVGKDMLKPHTIVLDPPQGYMYWIRRKKDSGNEAVIERANLDGTNRKIIVQVTAMYSQKLTIDYIDRRLYWSYSDSIKSSKLDGSDIRIFTFLGNYIQGVSQHEKFIYWIDKNTIKRADKTNGDNHVIIMHSFQEFTIISVCSGRRQDFKDENTCAEKNGGCSHLCFANPALSHSYSQTHHCACPKGYTLTKDGRTCYDKNNCSKSNGGCSHICMSNPKTFNTHHCACPVKYTLSGDGRTCSGPSEYILVSTGNAIIRVVSNPDTDNDTVAMTQMILPIDDIYNATVLAFDPVDRFIYWVDNKEQGITVQRIHETGEEASKVIDLEYEAYDMDIDPYSRTLYLACHDAIKVLRIDNSNSLIGKIKVGHNFRPQAIVLHPEKGVMYYAKANLPPYPSHIEMAQMDGSRFNQIVIPESASHDASLSLTLDKRNNRLYCAYLHLGRIESIDLNDGNYGFRMEVQNERPRGITIMGDFLYWFDTERLSYINMKSKENASIPLVGKITDVIHVKWNNSILWHPCSKHNGGCSHFCFLKENKTFCSCPAGLMLKPDRQTCYKDVNTIDPVLTESQNKNKSKMSKQSTIAIVVVVVAVILLACVLIFLVWRHKTKIGENGQNYEEVMTARMQSSDQPGGSSSGEDDSGLHVRVVRGKSLTTVASSESEVCLGPSCSTTSDILVK